MAADAYCLVVTLVRTAAANASAAGWSAACDLTTTCRCCMILLLKRRGIGLVNCLQLPDISRAAGFLSFPAEQTYFPVRWLDVPRETVLTVGSVVDAGEALGAALGNAGAG